jgi:general nucleoside transport system ATP-binding protein
MLVNQFTVAENLALVDVDIPGDNRLVRDLSVGEKARVELTKAIAKKPSVLILDEPTSVLTPSEAEELFDTARSLAASGAIVILISHKIREVLSVATRTVVMRRGRIVADGSHMSAEELARLMVQVEDRQSCLSETRTGAGTGKITCPPLVVAAGEIVAIIGVAGNGQTELATLLRDTLPRATTAHIPEDRTRDGVIAEMSIADNLALVTDEPAADLIAKFDIRATGPRQRAGSLSGGNQQKLVLARELARNPERIVAAEPTRGLDIEATRFVHDQLRQAASRGAATLLITSDLDEAFALAGAVHVIYRGKLSDRLTPSEAAARAGQLMAGVQ